MIRVALRYVLATLCVGSLSISQADPGKQDTPDGRYLFSNLGCRLETKVEKTMLKPCSPGGEGALRATKSVDILYKSKTVVVNKQEWVFVSDNDGRTIVAREPNTPLNIVVEVWFSRANGHATGSLTRYEVDAQHAPQCADAVSLSGAYAR